MQQHCDIRCGAAFRCRCVDGEVLHIGDGLAHDTQEPVQLCFVLPELASKQHPCSQQIAQREMHRDVSMAFQMV